MSDTVRVGSPQWDSRNQGFISPVRLQQFKATTPTHHFTSSTSINDKDDVDNVDIADDDAKDTMQNPQARPNPGNPANHSRSSSFFSFRKQANPSSASDIHNTPSLNGNAPGRRSVDQQQQPPPPQPQPQEPSSTSPKLPQAQAQSQSSPTQSQASQQGQLHPEIRSVVQLTAAHAHKVYVSGRLVRRVERDANGHRPTKDEGWTEVWAQLGGTTLSIWDMKAINEASKEGKEVPPTYINMTDAFVQVLGAITIPIPGSASERQENVLTLNTAGSNLLFFACPSTNALIAWASALRLSSWEKSRLEEIYTAHLIRITLSARDIPTTLTRGRLEGWVRVRIAGQTDWKSLWMVIAAAADDVPDELGRVASNTGSGAGPPGNTTGRIKRMSNLFSTKDNNNNNANIGPSFQRATVAMYPSPKPKDRKKAVLTLTDVTQAFAVYPERPELITRSTLIKLEGTMGAEDLAGGMRGREGWLLIMPQLEGNLSPAAEMLKWVIALHDAFKLYGRPQQWTWDPREPQSLMFAYPVGPHKDLLFLEREQAEKFDPREERTSVIRSRFVDIMAQKMQQSDPTQGGGQQRASTAPGSGRGYQLPPLSFDRTNNHDEDRHLLTPITERSSVYTHHGRSMSGDAASMLGPKPSLKGTINGAGVATGEAIPEEPRTPPVASGDDLLDRTGLTGGPISDSPRVSLDERAPPPPIKDGVGLGSTAPTRSPDSAYSPSSAVGGGRKSFDAVHNISSTNRSASPFGSPLRSPASGGKPSSLSNGGFEHKSPTPGSPSLSSLRSPHSPQPNTGGGGTVPERPVTPPGSILTSPYSPAPSVRQGSPTKSTFSFAAASQPFGSISRNSSTSASTMASVPSVPAPTPVATQPEDGGFHNEAGALYYMQQHGVGGGGSGGGSGLNGGPIAGRMPTTIAETDMDGDDGDDSSAEFSGPPVPAAAPGGAQGSSGPVLSAINASGRPSSASGQGTAVARQSTPMAFVERRGMNERSSTMGSVDSVYSTADSISASQSQSAPARQGVLGRKPSGARAQQVNSRMNLSGGNVVGSASPSSSPRLSQQPRRPAQVIEEEEMRDSTDGPTELAYASSSSPPRPARKESDVQTPATDDSSLDVLAALSYLDVTDPSQQQLGVERAGAGMTQPLKTNRASSTSPPPPASQPRALGAVKSSFAPSNKAAERKAKAQAQQAAAAAAASRPGRAANGKRKMRSAKADDGAWSSDEEEEEDEEEDEDEDNEEVDSDGEPASKPVSGANSSDNSIKPPQGGDDYFAQQATATHSRPPRNLPQIPTGRPGEADDLPPSRRPPVESQYSQQPMSQYYPQQPQMMSRNTMYEDNTPIRTQMEHPTPNHPRQHNMWSQVLDPGHHTGDAPSNTRDTFVQLESPAQTMTKAFTPQGLLSAGLHDKQGRSAKRQEELARESGASLINVPNKPPPPQTGLLGAITAHERERKRDGGVGAALTEREREKRLAEERQRRFDDAQRQQLDQMQQTGSMYGGQFGMNPMMMMNPMSMMGMNPMMTGGLSPMMTGGMTGGMNPMMSQYGMMGGYNPQHMFAAQQAAAQAYQQAMMAFSTAGSQVGGDGANGANNGGSPALNPMMTGNNMMGGMGMGGMGGMGFDPRMSMMMMNPMGMQNSGMSQFDPRMGPQNTGGSPSPLNDIPPSLLPPGGLGNNMPGSNSPARGGSPLARPTDSPRASRPTSPKPSQPVQ